MWNPLSYLSCRMHRRRTIVRPVGPCRRHLFITKYEGSFMVVVLMSECINLTLLRVYTGYIVTCMDWVFQCVIPSSCILQHIIASTCRRTYWQQRNFVKDVWGGNHATDCNGTASGGILFVSEVYGMHFTIPPNMSTWN